MRQKGFLILHVETGCSELDRDLYEYLPKLDLIHSNLAVIGFDYFDRIGVEKLKNHVVVLILTEHQESLIKEVHVIGAVSIYTIDSTQSLRSSTVDIICESLLLMRHQQGTPNDFYNALKPHFQAIYSASNLATPSSYEVLARIRFGKGKLLAPNIIMRWITPVESALIFESLVEHSKSISSPLELSFNIECDSLISKDGFEIIQRAVESNSTHKLTLEITESVFYMQKKDKMLLNYRFGLLNEMGVNFSLDDFGKKHSNYDRLHDYDGQFTQVKLDKKLFRQITLNKSLNDASLKVLNLLDSIPESITQIVIEGVEEKFQLQIVQRLQHYITAMGRRLEIRVQGFYLGRPEEIVVTNTKGVTV